MSMMGIAPAKQTRSGATVRAAVLGLSAFGLSAGGFLTACTETPAPKEQPEEKRADDGKDPLVEAAKQIREGKKKKSPADDPTKNYAADPPHIPGRLAAKRIFMQLAKVKGTRDTAFIPNSSKFIITGMVGGVTAYWIMDAESDGKAEVLLPTPLFDKAGARSARNRTNWYLGTPSVFPDGKHVIFAGIAKQPTQEFANTLGIIPIDGGPIRAVVAKDVTYAQDPDIHPDNKTVVFSTCEEIRVGTLKGREDQVLESVVIAKFKAAEGPNEAVCTVNHPRWSPDGKRIVFEMVGLHVDADVADEIGLPERLSPADFIIEPWLVDADGKNLTRLMNKKAFDDLGGRVKEGGTKHPEWGPEGQYIYFTHGRALARVRVDGTEARYLLPSNMPTPDGNGAVLFVETDPAISSDGRFLVAASRLGGKQEAPAGATVLDLAKVVPMRASELPTAKAAPPPLGGKH